MVDRLRAKPGGEDIPVVIGDMTTTRIDESFDLVYLVFNTIGNLTEQDAQVACFDNAARHLRPGSVFVIETEVPGVRWLPPTESFRVFHHGENTTWASTSTSRPPRGCSRTTTCARPTGPTCGVRYRSATPGRPSST